MNRFLTFIALSAIIVVTCSADVLENGHRWLNIYHNDRQFHSYKLNDIDLISHPETDNQQLPGIIEVYQNGEMVESIDLESIEKCHIGTNVPTIYINLVDHPDWEELQVKEDYLAATIKIDGNGKREDFAETAVNIKGRGNSTWTFPKKPYRLKFDKKQKVFGMKKAKSFALIANYIDETLLCNAMALELSRMIGVPFCNSWYPVRVVFNGINKGAYFITEKIGIGGGSVDIDENTGVLFELDSYFDETYKFRDATYNLPVNIKDPDFAEIASKNETTPEEMLESWQETFNRITAVVKNQRNIGSVIDLDDLCKFVLVNLIAQNLDIRWPRSTYVHMYNKDDKLHFGPTWDFDWAFGYSSKGGDRYDDQPFVNVNLTGNNNNGNWFYKDIVMTKEFEDHFRPYWNEFYETYYPQLLEFIDSAAAEIEASAKENGLLWSVHNTGKSSFDTENNVPMIKNWLIERVERINKHPHLRLHNGKTEDIFVDDQADVDADESDIDEEESDDDETESDNDQPVSNDEDSFPDESQENNALTPDA